MKIRFTACPPLLVTTGGDRKNVSIRYFGASGRIVAQSESGDGPMIYLSGTTNNGDTWAAWRHGFEVLDDPAAREIVELMLASGIAETL